MVDVFEYGADFADAELEFAGPCLTFADNRLDYGEERFVSLGLLGGRHVAIAHTLRGEATRINSMRKANRREQEIYRERRDSA